jgi:AcrR family transcriptional regulator
MAARSAHQDGSADGSSTAATGTVGGAAVSSTPEGKATDSSAPEGSASENTATRHRTAAGRASGVRERILDAATARFYASGIRAVSADRVIADAGVSKVTFYRHFGTKDELVQAYLSALAAQERDRVRRQRDRHPGNPAAVLRWYAAGVGLLSCAPGFRGCPFINAAAEYAEPGHPARVVVESHRAWLRGQAVDLLRDLGIEAPEPVAAILMMLRDGAMIDGYLSGSPEDVAARLLDAGTAVLMHALAQQAQQFA